MAARTVVREAESLGVKTRRPMPAMLVDGVAITSGAEFAGTAYAAE
jgi:hypothetical protein